MEKAMMNRPVVSNDYKFLEKGIEVDSVHYLFEHFGETMKIGQSTEPLYDYYGIKMTSICLDMEACRKNAHLEEGHFTIEWIFSNDLQIGSK